jgi:hypothetical protein
VGKNCQNTSVLGRILETTIHPSDKLREKLILIWYIARLPSTGMVVGVFIIVKFNQRAFQRGVAGSAVFNFQYLFDGGMHVDLSLMTGLAEQIYIVFFMHP